MIQSRQGSVSPLAPPLTHEPVRRSACRKLLISRVSVSGDWLLYRLSVAIKPDRLHGFANVIAATVPLFLQDIFEVEILAHAGASVDQQPVNVDGFTVKLVSGFGTFGPECVNDAGSTRAM